MKYKSLFRQKLVAIILMMIANTTFAQGPFPVGTINSGDSIVIIYDVTINNPLVPPNTPSISNQGTVSGGNFSNVITDDPDTGPGGDATITLLNVFPLPVTFGGFRAYEKNNDIELAWKILTEINTEKYEVEKSSNGRTFVKIGEVAATGASGIIDYTFLDIHTNAGDNYYRLRAVDRDGQFKYSAVVKVNLSNGSQIMIYPNPVSGKQVNVQMTKLIKGRYEFVLYNTGGQIVFKKYIDHRGGSASEVIQLPVSLASGLYRASLKKNETVFYKSLIMY